MSWIRNGYPKWRQVINEHYGSLDQFEDVSTVQIMHQIASKEVRELDAFFDALGTRLQDDPVVQDLRHDYTATHNAMHELLHWLEDRGMNP